MQGMWKNIPKTKGGKTMISDYDKMTVLFWVSMLFNGVFIQRLLYYKNKFQKITNKEESQ